MGSYCLTTGIAVALLVGCSRSPLRLNVLHLSKREAIARSTTILAGTVRSISIFGPTQQTSDGVLVRSWEVQVAPLLVLKGDLPAQEVVFFTNNYAPNVVQNGDFERLASGDRRIFFLVREGGRLRSVSDLYRTSIPLVHQAAPLPPDSSAPIAEQIGSVLLGEPPGESPRDFARILPKVATEALRTTGYGFVSSRLSQLSASGAPEVRTEACLTAYEQVFGGETCMERLEASSPSPEISKRMSVARKRREYLLDLARRSSGGCPLLQYTYGVEPEDPASVTDFLSFLAQQEDPILRMCGVKQIGRSVPPPQ